MANVGHDNSHVPKCKHCNNFAVKGKTVCARHGGKTVGKSGTDAATYKDGTFAKVVRNKKIGKLIAEAEKKTDLLERTEQMHLIWAMIADLLEQLPDDDNNAPSIMKIKEYYDKVSKAANKIGLLPEGSVARQLALAEQSEAYQELGRQIEGVAGTNFIYRDITFLSKQLNELQTAQDKRERDLELSIRAADVEALLDHIAGRIRNVIFVEIEDRNHAEQILQKINREAISSVFGREIRGETFTALPE